MNSFFENLRLAREKRGLSLDDIAVATRIRRSVLQAIEEGNIASLPQTYVRVFLRSYAKEVGLNESKILHDYDAVRKDLIPALREVQPRIASSFGETIRRIFSQKNIPLILAAALLLSLLIFLSVFNREDNTAEIKEVPFHIVVKQHEVLRPADDERIDSAATASTDETNAPQIPSHPPMILRAMTFDSVWIQIIIDGKIRKEYLAPPRWSGQWKAADHFAISLGNASAVSFTLNNSPLTMIGKPGKPVRNFFLRNRLASIEPDGKND